MANEKLTPAQELMRTRIGVTAYIPAWNVNALKRLARLAGKTKQDLLREAVADYLTKRGVPEDTW